jgi:hypothetical protein
MATETSIVQLLPTPTGWFVIRARAGEEGARGHYARNPIVAWAQLSNQRIVPVTIFEYTPYSEPVLHLDLLTDAPDFLGYDYPGCSVNWREATRHFHRVNWVAEQECWRAECDAPPPLPPAPPPSLLARLHRLLPHFR